MLYMKHNSLSVHTCIIFTIWYGEDSFCTENVEWRLLILSLCILFSWPKCPWGRSWRPPAPGEQLCSWPCGLTFLLRRQAKRWICPLGINSENKKGSVQGCLCPKHKTQRRCMTWWEVLPLTRAETGILQTRPECADLLHTRSSQKEREKACVCVCSS